MTNRTIQLICSTAIKLQGLVDATDQDPIYMPILLIDRKKTN